MSKDEYPEARLRNELRIALAYITFISGWLSIATTTRVYIYIYACVVFKAEQPAGEALCASIAIAAPAVQRDMGFFFTLVGEEKLLRQRKIERSAAATSLFIYLFVRVSRYLAALARKV